MPTALLVSNRLPGSAGGRAEKIDARIQLMDRHGWDVVIGHVAEPYVKGFTTSFMKIRRLAKRECPDLIVSINNPFHLHIHGYLLARVIRVPWIAELRDPIYSHPGRDLLSPRTLGARFVEELVVRCADQIVWYDGIQLADDYFRKKYGSVCENKVFKLPPIGYTKSSFETAEATMFEEFTITYAGSFYEDWIEPYTFLRGLGTYRSEGGESLTANFFGDWNEQYTSICEQAGVESWVTTHEFIPHDEMVSALKGSDILLYIGGDKPGNQQNLPSKLWDYIGARKPILAIVDRNFRAADFVEKHNLGIVVSPGDADGVASALRTLRNDEKTGVKQQHDLEVTREHSESVLADIMTSVVDDRDLEEIKSQSDRVR